MKWENCHNYVTEHTKHSKFGKLGHIRALFRFFELFLDYTLVDKIVGYTKLCAHREKEGTSFEITNESLRIFLGMLLLSGYNNLRNRKMYYETTLETFLQPMSY